MGNNQTSEVLYVLSLEDGYYYVGRTGNLQRRLQEHRTGTGSEWTKLHKLSKLMYTKPITSSYEEDMEVKVLMEKYGIDRVRGGTYSQVVLRSDVVELLQKEITHATNKCFGCGKVGHYVGNCPEKKRDVGDCSKVEKGERIGNGSKVANGSNVNVDWSLKCERCNRKGHTSATCYARTKEGVSDKQLCNVITKSGVRCSRLVGSGSKCYQHK